MSIDYSKCCIYKIQHIDKEDLVYVGHTTNFKQREINHKTICNNEKDKKHNRKLYQMIRANGGFDCFKMVMIEQYPCESKLEACKREDECMLELQASMNTCRAVFNKEEYEKQYRADHKEEINKGKRESYAKNKDKRKQYYEEHKDQKKEYMNEYYEKNKDEINRKRRETYKEEKDKNKERRKKYYEEHKDEIIEREKKYREEHKEQIKEYQRQYKIKNREEINKKKRERRANANLLIKDKL